MDTPEMDRFLEKINAGIKYFGEHKEEAIQYISTKLDYAEEDAREWMKTVRFAKGVKGVKASVVRETLEMLQKAGVIEGKAWQDGSEVDKAQMFVGNLKGEHSDV